MSKFKRISITIIGHNEVDHLSELLPDLEWADEIIYVDCESSDESVKIAKAHNCSVFQRPNNPNLNINKSFAMEQAEGEWIFYLDPDERIPEQLAEEILARIQNPQDNMAFYVNRRNHYFGKWLRHGSQYPDRQLRLFKRGHGQFPQQHVHERIEIDGKIGQMKHNLYHYPYQSISQYLSKFDFYTSFEADFLYRQGIHPGWFQSMRFLISKPITRFIRRYLLKAGFRDGWQGFFAAIFDSLNYAVRYFKLMEQLSREDEKNQ
ncbi:MAG: glycosyltransferase family 2 protein [Calditrichaeota bacterium]|nr:glycosyltransferase family 2 protein [Calditrichota bacterium]RQW00542.1 MAG: glycosyltransferase family 2 protein [Calditrichota bacterium]